jgi:hypothetical protein
MHEKALSLHVVHAHPDAARSRPGLHGRILHVLAKLVEEGKVSPLVGERRFNRGRRRVSALGGRQENLNTLFLV